MQDPPCRHRCSKGSTILPHSPIWFVIYPHWFVNAAFCTSKHPTTVKNARQIITFLPKHLHNSNKNRTFAATESATLPVRSANQGGSFAFIPMVRMYTKLPLSITDQVALLKSRGLQFADAAFCISNTQQLLKITSISTLFA